MSLFLILVVCALLWLAVAVAKEMHTEAKHRSDDRIMADYLKVEEARAHYQRLVGIDATVQATIDELDRIAAEARGEVIESTAVEIESQ